MKNTTEDLTKKYSEPLHIKGIGKVTEEGTLNLEGLIKSLLKSKYITG